MLHRWALFGNGGSITLRAGLGLGQSSYLNISGGLTANAAELRGNGGSIIVQNNAGAVSISGALSASAGEVGNGGSISVSELSSTAFQFDFAAGAGPDIAR